MTTSTGGRLMQTPEIEPLTIRPEDQARNVVDLIHRSVERYPGREAMRWKLRKSERAEGDDESAWTSRTYRQLWDWVTAVSLGLRDLGVADGDSVAIIARTRPEWTVSDLASLALGAVTCPIYPQSEAGQAAFVINNVRREGRSSSRTPSRPTRSSRSGPSARRSSTSSAWRRAASCLPER